MRKKKKSLKALKQLAISKNESKLLKAGNGGAFCEWWVGVVPAHAQTNNMPNAHHDNHNNSSMST